MGQAVLYGDRMLQKRNERNDTIITIIIVLGVIFLQFV